MGLWSRLFGSASKAKAGAKKIMLAGSPAGEALAQRQALAAKLLTPERQSRLAEAMQVQAAKQRLQRNLQSDLGQQQTAEALRRLLNKN
jgi:sRNA-binding protein